MRRFGLKPTLPNFVSCHSFYYSINFKRFALTVLSTVSFIYRIYISLNIMSALQMKSNKKPWTSEEDTVLMELVKEYGICGSWPKIALHMEYRSGKQCRERYINQLDPLIKKSMWTHEEDAIIKRMHHQVGKKWSKFMDHLPGRSDNAIKNRYHIISRDNYSDHNHHTTMKRAFELETIAKTEKGSKEEAEPTSFVPESVAVRLERFRSARDILDKKINDLLLEEELRCDPTIEEDVRYRNPLRHPRRLELLEEGNIDALPTQLKPLQDPELDFDICSFSGDHGGDDSSTTLSVSVSSDATSTPFALKERETGEEEEFAEMSAEYATYLVNNNAGPMHLFRPNMNATAECPCDMEGSPSESSITVPSDLMQVSESDAGDYQPQGYDFNTYDPNDGLGMALTSQKMGSFGMAHQASFGLSLSRQNSFGLTPLPSFGMSRPNSFGGGELTQQEPVGVAGGGLVRQGSKVAHGGGQPSVGAGSGLIRQGSGVAGGGLVRQESIGVAGGGLIRQGSGVAGGGLVCQESIGVAGGGLVRQGSGVAGGGLVRQSSGVAGGGLIRQGSGVAGGGLIRQGSGVAGGGLMRQSSGVAGGGLIRQGSGVAGGGLVRQESIGVAGGGLVHQESNGANSVGYDQALDFLLMASGPSPRNPEAAPSHGSLFNSNSKTGSYLGVAMQTAPPPAVTSTLFKSSSFDQALRYGATLPIPVAPMPRSVLASSMKPNIPLAPSQGSGKNVPGGRLDRRSEPADASNEIIRRPSQEVRPVW